MQNNDFFVYLNSFILGLGCIVEIMLVIFFCAKIFFNSKKNDLKSAYFLITVIGYIVDIISSGSAAIMKLIDPNYRTIYSIISKFTILYSDMHLGILSALMGFNKCTALAFPLAHRKIWRGSPLVIIICLFIITPLAVSQQYLFGPCLVDFWEPYCAPVMAEYYFLVIIINLPLLIITLIAIFIAIFLSRKQTAPHSDFKKVERRLAWQTIISSILLILYYTTEYLVGALYSRFPEITNLMYEVATIIYAIHTYPPIIILFVVSTYFRKQFMKFYGCHRIKVWGRMSTTIVVPLPVVK